MTGRSRAIALTIALVFIPCSALAEPTKDQCVDANTKAQELRRDRKLKAARTELLTCADPACPNLVRSDCNKRLDELENAQPTIVFEVKDAKGADAAVVTVRVDGEVVADKVTGAPIAVDPGPHTFTFELAGAAPVTRSIVITEGQKGRRERIEFPPTTTEPLPPPPHETSRGLGTQRVLGLVTGGVGIVGLGLGAAFGVVALSMKSKQESDCPNSATCTSAGHAAALDDHAAGITASTISTIGFIAGGVLLVTGVVLFLTGSSSAAKTAGFVVAPGISPQGSGVWLGGRF